MKTVKEKLLALFQTACLRKVVDNSNLQVVVQAYIYSYRMARR